MLEALRKGTGSWVVKILLGLLVISFAAWGIGRDTFSGIGQTGVATVGDTEITPQEFLDAFQREVRRLSAQFGGQLDTERARQFGVHESTLQRLVTRTLYDEAVRDFGLDVPDKVVAEAIRSNPSFKGQTGEFDRFQYEGVLRNSGLTPAFFEFQTRKDMVRNQLLSAVSGGSVAPKSMANALYRYRQEKRTAQIVVIANDAVKEIPAANDTDLIKYHRDNKARYTAPEYRALSWLELRPEDVAGDIAVTDENIKLAYEDRIDLYVTPEMRDVDQLLYASENEAGAIAAAKSLAEGATFETVKADKANLQGDKTSIGTVVKSNLPEEAQDAVFALAEGAVSAPIKTLFGWHLFRVSKINAGSTKTLAEVGPELKKQLQLESAGETLYKLSASLEDELAGGAKLHDAASRFGLKVRSAMRVDAGGADDKGSAVDLPKIDIFLSTAFETEVGVEPTLKESQNGSYFLVQVNDIVAPTLKPFETVRQSVTDDWRAKQRDEAAARKAADMVEKIKQGGNIVALAAGLGLDLKTSEALTRFSSGKEQEVSYGLLGSLFSAAIGDAVTSARPNNQGHVVAQLKAIEKADPAADPEGIKKLSQQLADSLSGDLLAQYQAVLQEDYEVKIYRQVLDSLF